MMYSTINNGRMSDKNEYEVEFFFSSLVGALVARESTLYLKDLLKS